MQNKLHFFTLCSISLVLTGCFSSYKTTHHFPSANKVHQPAHYSKVSKSKAAEPKRPITHKTAKHAARPSEYKVGYGEDTTVNPEVVSSWIKQADAILYHRDATPGDLNKAQALYHNAALSGDTYAQYMLGIVFQQGIGVSPDPKKSAHWFKRAERNRSTHQAQYRVGKLYANTQSPIFDLVHAAFWYERAAKGGHVEAANALGDIYNNGHAVHQNYMKALKWYGRAAARNSAYAQYSIGVIYYNGNGPEKDEKQAYEWLLKAAKHNFPDAQYLLGMMYETGIGVAPSHVEAYAWWSQIQQNKRNSDLNLQMAKLVKQMTPREIAQAISTANRYKHLYAETS